MRQITLTFLLLLILDCSGRIDDPTGAKQTQEDRQEKECARTVSVIAILMQREMDCGGANRYSSDCFQLSWIQANGLYACTGDGADIF